MKRLNSSLADSVLFELNAVFGLVCGHNVRFKQIQEKPREHSKDLFVTFVDLTKTFDTVSRDAVWVTLMKLGVPERMSVSSCLSIR